MRVDFGLEKDRDRRFGLWTLIHMLGAAPDLDVAFVSEPDRAAARRLRLAALARSFWQLFDLEYI